MGVGAPWNLESRSIKPALNGPLPCWKVPVADAVRAASKRARVGRIKTRKTGSKELTGLQVDVPARIPSAQRSLNYRVGLAQEALVTSKRQRVNGVGKGSMPQNQCVVGLFCAAVELVLDHLTAEGRASYFLRIGQIPGPGPAGAEGEILSVLLSRGHFQAVVSLIAAVLGPDYLVVQRIRPAVA